MARLLVSAQYLVLASDASIFTVLGYHPEKIIGQSILALTGPLSDPTMLQSAILNMQGHKMQVILYDREGMERRLIVSCSPLGVGSIPLGCLLTMHTSTATTLHAAFVDCPGARLLISADIPHAVHMVNTEFLRQFDCDRSTVLAKPQQRFCDTPDSISASFDPDSAQHRINLLRTALEGRICISDVLIEDVSCVPVAEALNGRIRHYLFTFDAPNTATSGSCPAMESSKACPVILNKTRVSNPASRAIISPRKTRARGALAPVAPVVVTRELVARLSDRPLHKAAEAAGVCATAFKKACRKLGMPRWSYQRAYLSDTVTEPAAADGFETNAARRRIRELEGEQ